MSKSRGFTLIELLITISIIAILSAIGLVVYSSVLKQGRDSKRQSDLRSIQSALEQYNSDQFFYPSNNVPGRSMDVRLQGGGQFNSNIGNPLTPSPLKIYMNSLPQDPTSPTGSTRYAYRALPASPACDNSPAKRCTSYCLYAKLENVSSRATLPSGCLYPSNSYNFVVTPP